MKQIPGLYPSLDTRDILGSGPKKNLNEWTKKLMSTHKALHPRDDIDRLYA